MAWIEDIETHSDGSFMLAHLKMIIPLKHRVDFAKIMFLMSEDYNDDMPRSLRHSTYHHDP